MKAVQDERGIRPYTFAPLSDLQQKFSTASVQDFQAQNNLNFTSIDSEIGPSSTTDSIPYFCYCDTGGDLSALLVSSNDGTIEPYFTAGPSSTLSLAAQHSIRALQIQSRALPSEVFQALRIQRLLRSNYFPKQVFSDAPYFSASNISTAVPSTYESDYRSDFEIS